MGRRKRTVHPWSSLDHATAACVTALGAEAVQEGIETFRAVSQESNRFGPSGDDFIPWMADLLFVLARRYRVRITGGVATLLWIASGARPLVSEDQFDRSRKNWDEAIRRARKREFFGGPGIFGTPVRRFHEQRVRMEQRKHPLPGPTAESYRVILEFELDQLGRAVKRLPQRELKLLLDRVRRLHATIPART